MQPHVSKHLLLRAVTGSIDGIDLILLEVDSPVLRLTFRVPPFSRSHLSVFAVQKHITPMTPPTVEISYAPWPVADTRDQPSIRDDVRRVIYENAFRPSHTHYTLVDDIYNLFLIQTSQTHSDDLQERFRSALGRVLRPPSTAGSYAQSYKADVRRWRGYISFVSDRCEYIDVKETVRRLKRQNAVRRREFARHSDSVKQLRLVRKQRRESVTADGDLQQRISPMPLSFRYVDEFLDLNCAEDLTRLKVGHCSSFCFVKYVIVWCRC